MRCFILQVKVRQLTYILVGFLELCQHLEAGLHDGPCPIVDLVILVRVTANRVLHRLLNDLAYIIDDEEVLE